MSERDVIAEAIEAARDWWKHTESQGHAPPVTVPGLMIALEVARRHISNLLAEADRLRPALEAALREREELLATIERLRKDWAERDFALFSALADAGHIVLPESEGYVETIRDLLQELKQIKASPAWSSAPPSVPGTYVGIDPGEDGEGYRFFEFAQHRAWSKRLKTTVTGLCVELPKGRAAWMLAEEIPTAYGWKNYLWYGPLPEPPAPCGEEREG